ncbi:class I SAM-dependent methyltransferase [Streptomyces sp. NPDC005728]|uniref:class I SAM-dependent methyltransferase n=1 Tax=Streptomyces sp. NPDC005728 TaxID=3157054 RepID=UPI003408A2FC
MTQHTTSPSEPRHLSGESQGYQHGAFAHRTATELDRLLTLQADWDTQTKYVVQRLHPERSWDCLELGAGAGSIARWLAMTCPGGHTIATDLDTGFLTGNLPDNLHVLRHDVTHESFAAGSFDLIHARALFVHLPARQQILTKAAGWLKPGGWLVIEDPDVFPALTSPHPLFCKAALAGAELLHRTLGTDLHWPRTQPAPLLQAGLTQPGLHISIGTVGDDSASHRLWQATFDQIRPALLRENLLTPDEAAELDALVGSPTFRDACLATVSAWARRTHHGR